MVKQTLRRLRWHHEHAGDVTLGLNKGRQPTHAISSDVCCFIMGDNMQSNKNKKDMPMKEASFWDIEEAMKCQHNRAEV